MTGLPPEVQAAQRAVAEARAFEASVWKLRTGVAEGWMATYLLGVALLPIPASIVFTLAMFALAGYFGRAKRWRRVWQERDVWNWGDLLVLLLLPLVLTVPATAVMSGFVSAGQLTSQDALRSIPFLGLVGYGLAVGYVGRRRRDPYELGTGAGMMIIGAGALWGPVGEPYAAMVVAAAFLPLLALAFVRIWAARRSMGGLASKAS